MICSNSATISAEPCMSLNFSFITLEPGVCATVWQEADRATTSATIE